MASQVNPTRMELYRLKKRLATARRGHKLLKDKQDEMIRQFMLIIKKNRALRIEVEATLAKVMAHFNSAKLKMSYEGIMEALMVPSREATLSVGSKTIMNIKTPQIEYKDVWLRFYPLRTRYRGRRPFETVAEDDRTGLARKSMRHAGDGNRKDEKKSQRDRIHHDPRHGPINSLHHDETGRQRTGKHHQVDEIERDHPRESHEPDRLLEMNGTGTMRSFPFFYRFVQKTLPLFRII
jgi:hypothetical protein